MNIEFILKESTIDNIRGPWVRAGKVDNAAKGSFVFKDIKSWESDEKLMTIYTEDDIYIYNISDFYRIKITGAL